MAKFFTSDQHFSHNMPHIYKNRGFSSIEEHDMALLGTYNKVVSHDDLVYNLGDISMSNSLSVKALNHQNGSKELIAGNHDAWHPMYSKSWQNTNKISAAHGVLRVSERQVIKLPFVGKVMLTHLPAVGEHGSLVKGHDDDDRFKVWRPRLGEFGAHCEIKALICGHVHDEWLIHKGQVNVGVDVHYMEPVPAGLVGEMALWASKNPDRTLLNMGEYWSASGSDYIEREALRDWNRLERLPR